ncbi:putative Class II aldolase/adducin N-terminal domain-containing protein [Seiridium cardinale]
MDWYSNSNARQEDDWSKQNYADLKRKLIAANHILDFQGVVDAYGHISIRHPQNPEIYLMSGYMAPALVKSSGDLIEYWVNDSSTVDPKAGKGYSERFIHGEMFRMYPDVNCVVHSHAEDVLPYVAATEVPMTPVFHMAGFLGSHVPVFDIEKIYEPDDQQDMLIRNARFGTALAKHFSQNPNSTSPSLDRTVVLMRRHGYTTHGTDIETAVYRAIYTKVNAGTQTNTLLVRNAFDRDPSGVGNGPGFEPMSEKMLKGCQKMNEGTQDKPWALWVAQVENNSLYRNLG